MVSQPDSLLPDCTSYSLTESENVIGMGVVNESTHSGSIQSESETEPSIGSDWFQIGTCVEEYTYNHEGNPRTVLADSIRDNDNTYNNGTRNSVSVFSTKKGFNRSENTVKEHTYQNANTRFSNADYKNFPNVLSGHESEYSYYTIDHNSIEENLTSRQAPLHTFIQTVPKTPLQDGRKSHSTETSSETYLKSASKIPPKTAPKPAPKPRPNISHKTVPQTNVPITPKSHQNDRENNNNNFKEENLFANIKESLSEIPNENLLKASGGPPEEDAHTSFVTNADNESVGIYPNIPVSSQKINLDSSQVLEG